jgi:hypothetical protein
VLRLWSQRDGHRDPVGTTEPSSAILLRRARKDTESVTNPAYCAYDLLFQKVGGHFLTWIINARIGRSHLTFLF